MKMGVKRNEKKKEGNGKRREERNWREIAMDREGTRKGATREGKEEREEQKKMPLSSKSALRRIPSLSFVCLT